jgi:hypothetical protein
MRGAILSFRLMGKIVGRRAAGRTCLTGANSCSDPVCHSAAVGPAGRWGGC